MQYPGRVIKLGETDAAVVKALKTQLNKVLALRPGEAIKLDPEAPAFDETMRSAVKLFQSRSVDSQGTPLVPDGKVGAITWAALFGDQKVPVVDVTGDALLAEVVKVAAGEEARQVREVPPSSNRGPDVEMYLKSVGVAPGNAWCAAFVFWCFKKAAENLGRTSPVFKTGGCLAHWNGAPSVGAQRIVAAKAVADPSLLHPGTIFIMDHGGGLGHTGLIESVAGGMLTTLEGNSNSNGSRDGVGVFRLTRKINTINKGFIDYTGL